MAKKLRQILALTMALTVLVSSHSFAYFEHLCTLTKVKKLSFDLVSCAGDLVETPPTEALTLKKGTCCKITFKVNKADNAVQQAGNLAVNPLVAEEITIPVFTFEPEVRTLSEEPVFGHGDSSPPPSLPLYLLNEQFIL